MLSQKSSYEMLKFYGIPVASFCYATNKDEAELIRENLRFPVVLKIDSPNVVHKTDIEAVKVCYSIESFKEDFDHLFALGKKLNMDGILIQEFVKGYECIVGVKIDKQFGPVILFGSGGVLAEAINNVSTRLIPISRKDAEQMIEDTGIDKILNFRTNKIDKECIIDVLLKVSGMAEKEGIKELDINPLFINNFGALAADVRIVIEFH